MTRMNCCGLKLRLENDGCSDHGDGGQRALRWEHFKAYPHDAVAPPFDGMGLQVGERQVIALRSCVPIGPELRLCMSCPRGSRSSVSPIRTTTEPVTTPAYLMIRWPSKATCVVTGIEACCALDRWTVTWVSDDGRDRGGAGAAGRSIRSRKSSGTGM